MFFKKIFKQKLNVLMSGHSNRDCSMARAISKSPYLNKLYYWGVNSAISEYAENIGKKPTPEIEKFLKEKEIDLLICQTESELCIGTYDIFKFYYGVPTFGVSKEWTKLESSKYFAKQFMQRNNILTPDFALIEAVEDYEKIADDFGFPVVIKQNSFFRGFGVYIAKDREEAIDIIKTNLSIGNFEYKDTTQKNKLIVEKYIQGKEISQMLLWDGKTLVPFCPVRDYKKSAEKNQGCNTGGLGAIVPVPLSKEEEILRTQYIKQLEKALKKEKATDFTGVIYAGLMFSNNKLYTLEYNIRFGDPELQVLLDHLDSDFLEILYLVSRKKARKVNLKYKKGKSLGIILYTKEYLNPKKDEKIIVNLPQNKNKDVSFSFSCSEKTEKTITFQNFVRPIFIGCNDKVNPQKVVYREAAKFKEINDNLYYRTDIGFDVLQEQKED